MSKLFATTALAALLALGGPALAQTQKTEQRPAAGAAATDKAEKKEVDRGDRKFMENAAEGGMKEVTLGKMAQQKAQNAEVKQLADMIVKDHEAANEKLMTLAKSMGVDLSEEVAEGKKEDVEDFEKLSGAQFDKKYVEEMLDDHREDVEEFEEAAKNAKDPQLKAFAAEVAPKLRQHLQMAEAARKAMQPQTSSTPGATGGNVGSTRAPAGSTGSGSGTR
jgi:putative membrane protein